MDNGSETEIWRKLPKKVRQIIVGYLDPLSKLNLSLCSRRTWNHIVERPDYFHKIRFKYVEDLEIYYEVGLFYDDHEDPQNFISFSENKNESSSSSVASYFINSDGEEEARRNDSDDDYYDDHEYKKQKLQEMTEIYHDGEFNEFNKGRSEIVEGEFLEVATNFFKNLLEKHQNYLAIIEIEVDHLTDVEHFEIIKFPRLKQLTLSNYYTFEFFLNKIPENIEELTLTDVLANILANRIHNYIGQFSQLQNVTDFLSITDNTIYFEQFLKLKARVIRVHVIDLTIQKIKDLLHSWLNNDENFPGNLQTCTFEYKYYRMRVSLDFNEILEGIEYIELGHENFDIGHLIYSSYENRKIVRIMNKTNPNSYMDILHGDLECIMAINNDICYEYDQCKVIIFVMLIFAVKKLLKMSEFCYFIDFVS